MSEQSIFEIRRATEADLKAIAHVLVDTWRTTFRGLLSDDFLDSMSYEDQRERHRRTMLVRKAPYFVAISVRTNKVIGFASGGASRHSEYPYPGELYAIYVRQAYQGRSIGKRLFCALADQLLQSGLSAMIAWVLVNNPNRGFYQRVGGREIATQPITLGPTTVDEVAFVWDNLGSTLRSM
jgi:ribosomal protein S18 acetylase RimI-like enzyme